MIYRKYAYNNVSMMLKICRACLPSQLFLSWQVHYRKIHLDKKCTISTALFQYKDTCFVKYIYSYATQVYGQGDV